MSASKSPSIISARNGHASHGNRLLLHLLALGIASGLCAVLVVARIHQTGSHGYTFLLWNLFLAWVPFLLSSALWLARRAPTFLLLLGGVVWLAFFPNAPYIVTDFVHLRRVGPAPVWYDVVMISSFAWTGLILGIISLRQMQGLVCERLGRVAGWVFAIAALALGGFGVYLGRFERWNSWDLLTQPREILGDVAGGILNPFRHQKAIVIVLVFTTFLTVAYLLASTLLVQRFERGERNY